MKFHLSKIIVIFPHQWLMKWESEKSLATVIKCENYSTFKFSLCFKRCTCQKENRRITRLCIYFRALDQRTLKDSFSLPRIDEIFYSFLGYKYFSILDMKSGYHQIEMEEKHKERTVFTVDSLEFYKYNRMAFGLANAPATYQRLMKQCLGQLHLRVLYTWMTLLFFPRLMKNI